MPNLIKSLYTALKGKPAPQTDDLAYLRDGFDRYYFSARYPCASHCNSEYPSRDGDVDDASSISSFSTNATMDDIPGPGRLVDKFLYQRLGRKLEKLALRFRIPSLSPAEISRYIEREFKEYSPFETHRSLSDIMDSIVVRQDGATYVAGLKALVKRAQTGSLYQSEAALVALIRVSADWILRGFYLTVSGDKPIRHLESLVRNLHDVHPEKKYFLFLIKLAKANVVSFQVRVPTVDLAQELRQKLSYLLYRFRNDPFNVLGEACLVFAQAVTCTDALYNSRNGVYLHILNTLYLYVIFFLQSIPYLFHLAESVEFSSQRHIQMIVSTFVHWLDAALYRYVSQITPTGMFDSKLLHASCAYYSLYLAAALARSLLPRSFQLLYDSPLVEDDVLPRKLRRLNFDGSKSMLVKSKLRLSTLRSQRLLSSLSELEREVRDGSDIDGISMHSDWTYDADELFFDELKYTFDRARKIKVEENYLTQEFINVQCRDYYLLDYDDDDEYVAYAGLWGKYKSACRLRSKCGEYFRSNMEWDWDVGGSLKRLFKLEDQHNGVSSPTEQIATNASHAIHVDGLQSEAWNISVRGTQSILPKEVRITYITETGETRWMTLVPEQTLDGHSPDNISTPQEESVQEESEAEMEFMSNNPKDKARYPVLTD